MLRLSIPMPATLTNRIIMDAGCDYWLRDYQTRLQANSAGYWVALHIGAPHDPAECSPVAHSRIGAQRIAHALETMLTSGNVRHAERAGRVLAGLFDAPDADVVLQFAAFGEVIYG